MRVGDVARDEPVSVERDGGDVENGRRATEHIGRRPEVTEYTTQSPITADHLLRITRCIYTSLFTINCSTNIKRTIQESPANAKGTRDSSACMKAHCEQM